MSGSGKSELLKAFIKEDIIRNKEGIVVIDPNGDFAFQIARFKENLLPSRKDKLIYIDPTLSDFVLPVINPFELPADIDYFDYNNYQNLLEPRAGQVATALIQIFMDLDANFSPKMIRYVLPAVCAVLLKKNGGFDDLLRLFDDNDREDLLELGRKSPNEVHRHDFQKWDVPHTTSDAIKDKLKLLLQYSKFRDLTTGKSTIDITKEVNDNKLIIFNLSKGALGVGVSKYFGKLIICMIQAVVLQREKISEHLRPQTILYIDEAHNYLNKSVEEMLQDARKYGCYMYLASQQTGQGMDADMKMAVYGNTKIKIMGTQQDPQSIKTVSGFMNLKIDEVRDIPFHHFYIKVGMSKPILMKTTSDNINDKNCMTWEQWNDLKEGLLSSYYRQRSSYKSKDSTNIPPEENEFKFNPKYED